MTVNADEAYVVRCLVCHTVLDLAPAATFRLSTFDAPVAAHKQATGHDCYRVDLLGDTDWLQRELRHDFDDATLAWLEPLVLDRWRKQ